MSMAASCSSSCCSASLLHTKLLINNPSFFPPLPIPTHFLSKPHLLLKLSSTPPSFLRRRPLAASHTFQFDEEEEDELIIPNKEEQEEEGGKLYVGNLPYSMTASQLEDVFQQAGRVINVEVIYDRVTDRSRGFGFVTMGSVEEAQEAIRLFNGSQVGGRNVKVNFPEVPKGGEREVMTPRIRSTYKGFVDSPHKIYAGNLGWRLTSEGLRGAFAKQQGLLSAKVIYERDTGRSRGFGFVSFETAEDADAALNAMNGVEVEGRPLRLNLATERARPLTLQENAENNVESIELLSSIGA